jgi:hypothetical protein
MEELEWQIMLQHFIASGVVVKKMKLTKLIVIDICLLCAVSKLLP